MSFLFITRKRLFVLVFFLSNFGFSQVEEATSQKTFLQVLGGETPKKAITFMPGGMHMNTKDYMSVWYVGVQYKVLEYMAFKNSFGDFTAGVLFKRTLPFTRWFSMSYGAGLMVGYQGKLENHPEIPLSATFLYSGNINPIVGVDVSIKITHKIALQASLASWVMIYGVKYYF